MKYPVGIETFKDIIKGGYVYVDKTAFIRELQNRGKYYFISRPRRFGKSLFLSMLESYFKGERELFKNLAISSMNVDWTPRPVFKFAFNDIDTSSIDNFKKGISEQFSLYENQYNIEGNDLPLPQRFLKLIRTAFEESQRQVAILIDEYDSALLSTIEDDKKKVNEEIREIIKPIFTVLKTGDRYIHFAFITGVSRFSHTSLFSGANNIPDRSLEARYSDICGITETELLKYFSEGIKSLAINENLSYEETIALLKENYDGYHFSEKSEDIYNPYSIIRAFDSQKISDYWFQSGTPGFLVKLLKRDDFYLPDLDSTQVEASDLTPAESFIMNPVSLMYESGYLTIKGYDNDSGLYTLGIPNAEVTKGLATALLPLYSNSNGNITKSFISKIRVAISKGDANELMSLIKTFLEGNPYSNSEKLQRETYFKNNIYLIFKLLGFNTHVETETCRGRTDLILTTKNYIYIFELKYNGSAEDAIRQIDEKRYAEPYRHDDRKVIKIGANYSSRSNNIDSWIIN